MRRTVLKLAFAAGSLAALAGPALAHVGAGHADGFAAGMAHSFLGLDHLMAMAAVGVWSATAAPSRPWAAPAAFVGMMIAGAALSFAGIGLPAVEGMVALSVLALGLMIVAGAGLPAIAGVGLTGLFALFHGHAHADEATGAALAYVAGFSLSTAALHGLGVGIGLKLARSTMARAGLGILVAGSGAALVFGG
ncbi:MULTISPECIES: HupE/UreJ family protein [unclassified Mesorhizobium]|uniref:HupE/UreJ family protein n=1 Tax=unclassified Mesorhizobium TaxID=325217 RepID=UPI000F74FFEE|nr:MULTISPECIES: HupE/UreJ family protein [unclassified Mesorhizobium]AZO25523.1 HupE/UreJ family protein [Mesorhizobium sp. M1E.F.Ca.ET.045.02.1.1]RUW34614.1 HupE/UreJ family protein [Mesorhizobium sp. M1E.F.Ca.ET.041.01.1.1]RWD90869.1 MAG: HupE/UreJ family protein [Mesorhizobium sp.]RWD92180.1 MAG: HupE/UreJ family protein [Mesorhizobium sp.]